MILVSIIVPAYNEERFIAKCLSSIQQLDYPSESLEVIIVDNGSTDRTVEIAKKFGYRTEVFPKISVSALRNSGSKIAKGDVFAFLDGDCVVSRNWIKNAIIAFNDPKVGIVGCSRFLIPDNSSWVEKSWNSQTNVVEGYVKWVGSGNLMIKRDLFTKLKGFNESIITSEDCDLCFRLAELNFKVLSTGSVSVTHLKVRKTIKDFYDKELWHGKGVLKTFLKSKGKKMNFSVLFFALIFLICIIGTISGLIYSLYSRNFLLLWGFGILMILCAFTAAIKKSSSLKLIPALTILYFFYGTARAISMFDLSIFAPLEERRKK